MRWLWCKFGIGYHAIFNTDYLKSDQIGHAISEDCLTLNVIRPANASNLPVAVWIHGGGLYEGGSADLRYNLSFIVQNSVDSNNPMIGVSINYRLSAWGFLYSQEIQDEGVTNLGFRDQRLALHWIKENIAAFGGNWPLLYQTHLQSLQPVTDAEESGIHQVFLLMQYRLGDPDRVTIWGESA